MASPATQEDQAAAKAANATSSCSWKTATIRWSANAAAAFRAANASASQSPGLSEGPSILILDRSNLRLDAGPSFSCSRRRRLITNRTTFIIAHRLSTVVHADQILVLKQGRIIERGDHKQLMEQDGYYASLVKRQIRGLLAA